MAEDVTVTNLLDQPVERAARVVALRLLQTAEDERQRLEDDDDPEALHDFRVAVRRLRSWLKAFKEPLRSSVSGKRRDALRSVAQATNEGRDAEVHVAWLRSRHELLRGRRRPGTEWLIEQLQSQRQAGTKRLNDEVARHFVPVRRKLAADLEVYARPVRPDGPETTFAACSAVFVREQAEDLRRNIQSVTAPGKQDEAHRARIAAKHLRYLLEPVAAEAAEAEVVVARLKELQDVLGALHDAHVFGGEVAAAMAEAARHHAQQLSATILEGNPGRLSVHRAKRDPLRPGLLAIVRRLRAAADDSFAGFAARWGGEAASPFWDAAEEVTTVLRGKGRRSLEIERKYLLSRVPDPVRKTHGMRIEQGYLPGERLVERMRRVKNGRSTRWYRTVKIGRGLARVEIEEETTRAVFDRMWPLTKGRRLTKRRRRVPAGAVTWEIDEFTDRMLVLAEVELPSEDAGVEIPEWLRPHLIREVTDDEDYQNVRLAR